MKKKKIKAEPWVRPKAQLSPDMWKRFIIGVVQIFV